MRKALAVVGVCVVIAVVLAGAVWVVSPSRGVGRYQLADQPTLMLVDTKTGELYQIRNYGGTLGVAWTRWVGPPRKPLNYAPPNETNLPPRRWDIDGNPIK